jgi:hypothetical protein
MSPPEPLGPLRELWLGHVVWWDAALGLGRVSGAADERFGSFPFVQETWRAEGQPVVGQSVTFVAHPTTRRVLEVAP